MTRKDASSEDRYASGPEALRVEASRRLDGLFATFGQKIAMLADDDALESVIEGKNHEIGRRDETIAHQRAVIETLRAQLDARKKDLAEKQTRIVALRHRLNRKSDLLADRKRGYSRLLATRDRLRRKLEKRDTLGYCARRLLRAFSLRKPLDRTAS